LKKQCDICNQLIEPHLIKQKKSLCFSCLTEELSSAGAVSTFSIKEKPVIASCAVCDLEVSGHDLFPAPWGFLCKDCRDFCETQSGLSWELVKVAAKREWLVKANSRIQGPFTQEEIENRLLDNRIVSLDEVTRPMGRWHLMRDEESFRSVLNEIKNSGSLKDRSLETTTSGEVFDNQQTSSLENFIDKPFIETIKPIDRAQVTSVKDVVPTSEVVDVSVKQNSRDLIRKFEGAATNSVPTSRVPNVKPSSLSSYLFMGIFTVLVVILTIKLTKPQISNIAGKDRSFDELMERGLRNEKIGAYQTALADFNEARILKPNDSELLLHLAPLTLIYDRQTLQASRMFKEIQETEKGLNYQKASALGLGLIALESHDLQNAEDLFDRAISLDPDYIPAIANRGIVAFYKGELENAEGLLVKALTKGGPEGAIVITLADVAAAQVDNSGGNKKDHTNALWQTHSMLDAFLSLERDYEQEALIQDARIFTLMKKPAEAIKRIDDLLDVDPEKSDLHVREWGIFRGRASWGLLLDSLKKVSQELPPSPRMTAAIGLAMYRGREKLDGAQSIEQALSQAPRDPLLMALAGWVEMKLGRREMGVVNIKEASLMPDKFKLPHILQARLCQDEKDWDCAQRHWSMVHEIDTKSVEALFGLANVAWQKKNVEGATTWLRQAQAMDPAYAPLLALNQEMQSNSKSASTSGANP
jgi:tetratricopeptide (TPR) repeat protein